MINCKKLLNRLIFIFLFLIGHTHPSYSSTIEIIDPVPFSTPRYIDTLDFSYFHDILDNGYNALTDTLINATLSILFIDDDPEGEFQNWRAGAAMFDFDGPDEEEVSIFDGDEFMILEDLGEWLLIRKPTGEQGYVPASYVECLSNPFPKEIEILYLFFDGVQHIDGISQTLHLPTGTVYNLNVPTSYLLDGKLNVNIISGYALDYIFQDAYLTVNIERTEPIPEPSAIFLFVSGFLGITKIRRKRAGYIELPNSF